MRILVAVVIIGALGWSAFWWLGARAVDRDLTAWVADRQNTGWVAHIDDIQTRGFPNRFDTTLSGVELADPNTGIAWTAPFFQVFRLSYEPGHIIAIWPQDQMIATPNQRINITTERARASFVFETNQNWTLDRSNIAVNDAKLTSNRDWSAEIAEVLLATRMSDRVPGAIDIGFDAKDIRPANPALRKLAQMDVVPGVFESTKIDASLTFDRPWDRFAIETARPNLTALDLHKMQLNWGQLELWAAGELQFDAQGRATGSITVKAKNWREILQLLVATGWLPTGIANPLETGLELLATLAGSKTTLDAPLTIKDGSMSFGPIPLGTIPALKIR